MSALPGIFAQNCQILYLDQGGDLCDWSVGERVPSGLYAGMGIKEWLNCFGLDERYLDGFPGSGIWDVPGWDGDKRCLRLSAMSGMGYVCEIYFSGEAQEESETKDREMEMALREKTERLEELLALSPAVYYRQQPDFTISYLARPLDGLDAVISERWFQAGEFFLETIPDPDRRNFLQEAQGCRKLREKASLQYRIRRGRDEGCLYVLDYRSPQFTESGLFLGYHGLLLDITRQTIAENRLTSSAWKESLAMLTSGLVHDFSNVMAGIFAISELYHENMEPSDPMYEGVGQIKKSSREAQKLVRRIIELNREVEGNRNYFNVEHLIRDQEDLLRIILSRGTELRVSFPQGEIPVYLDDVQFRQMLLNFAMNSRDAMTEGGCFSITVEKLSPGENVFPNNFPEKVQHSREMLRILIADSGCGIEASHLDRIFDPFFTTKEAEKGSGIGLYNIRLFIEGMGGRIGVVSEKGSGTTFCVTLPVADFSESDHLKEDEEEDPPPERPTVLFHTPPNADSGNLVSCFQLSGWQTREFRSVKDILQFMESYQILPQAIVLIANLLSSEWENHVQELFQRMPRGRVGLVWRSGETPEFEQLNPESFFRIFNQDTPSRKIFQVMSEIEIHSS